VKAMDISKNDSGVSPYVITHVDTTDKALAAVKRLALADAVAGDTETVARDDNGDLFDLDVHGPGPMRVLSLAGKIDGVVEAFVFDFPESSPVASGIRSIVGDYVARTSLYAWNADFDERVLEEAGIPAAGWYDLMLSQASLVLGSSGVSYYDSLSRVASRYLGLAIEGKGTIQLSYTRDVPRSEEQIHYAGFDAVVTCDLIPVFAEKVGQAGLEATVKLEWEARPFRSMMERRGIGFDVLGWRKYLISQETALNAAGAELARLTGGGQATLFDPVEKPMWNPGSAEDVKRILNTHAEDEVRKYLGGRLFEKADSVDSAALKLLGHPIADTLLEWRDHQKTLSTYGEKFISWVRPDGRVHARYLQCVVSTGRMSSSKPNMQNNDPLMKEFYTPDLTLSVVDGAISGDPNARVFVLGDLGQAELRVAAQVSGDEALIEAFLRGDDMHVVTAGRMFGLDMEDLKANEPKAFKLARQRGKTMNFAVIYGLGPRALAQTLTLAGIPTTEDEAAELQRLYLAAFPKVSAWLSARDATVREMIDNPVACDFGLTLRLVKLLPKVNKAKEVLADRMSSYTKRDIVDEINSQDEVSEQLAAKLGRAPSVEELEEETLRRCEMVSWSEQFKAPVVVDMDGNAVQFESRTAIGRRRIFNVSTARWLDSIISSVVRAKRGDLVQIRKSFEEATGQKLTTQDGSPLGRDALKKRFENKDLKDAFVSHVFRQLGGNADKVCYRALADCIGSLGNAYRNAPIQGGVADAVMLAFGMLNEELKRFDDAFPVQSVHDSIVIECSAREAVEVAGVLKDTMEAALRHFCPSVPAIADVEISASLDTSKHGIDFDQLASFLA